MPHLTFEAVIWDMDGLLFDTERLSYQAWRRSAQELGQKIDNAVFAQLIGRNPAGIRAKLSELLGPDTDVEALARGAGRHYDEVLKDGPPLKRGAKEAITFLAENNVPQAVATSSTLRLATKKLGAHGLLPLLDALVTGDQVAEGKPAPEPYLLAAQRLDVPPHDCLAFEDSVNGILSAHQAGMKTVLIPDLAEHNEASMLRVWRTYDSLEAAFPLLYEVAAHVRSKRV